MGLAGAIFATTALVENVKWDMANEYQATSIHGQAQSVFADIARDASGGSIEITNHFGGSIGYKSKGHFDAVGDDALPIANTSMGQVAGIGPMFSSSLLPFWLALPLNPKLYGMLPSLIMKRFLRVTIRYCFMHHLGPADIWAKKQSCQVIVWPV